jgi:hypothetical protein
MAKRIYSRRTLLDAESVPDDGPFKCLHGKVRALCAPCDLYVREFMGRVNYNVFLSWRDELESDVEFRPKGATIRQYVESKLAPNPCVKRPRPRPTSVERKLLDAESVPGEHEFRCGHGTEFRKLCAMCTLYVREFMGRVNYNVFLSWRDGLARVSGRRPGQVSIRAYVESQLQLLAPCSSLPTGVQEGSCPDPDPVSLLGVVSSPPPEPAPCLSLPTGVQGGSCPDPDPDLFSLLGVVSSPPPAWTVDDVFGAGL